MSYGVRMVADILRSTSFGVIGAGYVPIGAVFMHQMRIISIKNLTNANLLISFDGIEDNDIVPLSAGVVYDFCANKTGVSGALMSIGTTIYVKDDGVAPTSGAIYLTCFYGYGE